MDQGPARPRSCHGAAEESLSAGGTRRARDPGRSPLRWKAGACYLSAKTLDGRALTSTTERKARLWLADHGEAILAGHVVAHPCRSPVRGTTLATYAETWLASRDLSERTRDHC